MGAEYEAGDPLPPSLNPLLAEIRPADLEFRLIAGFRQSARFLNSPGRVGYLRILRRTFKKERAVRISGGFRSKQADSRAMSRPPNSDLNR